MPIDIDVRSFAELNSNYTDINGKVNSLRDMALNPVPAGSNNKIAVRRSTVWSIEGEEAYNGQFQELGNISGDAVLELNTTTSRTAIIATITDHTFVTSFGTNMLTSHVYTIFLKQNSTGNHSVRWPYGASVLNMVGPDPNQITAVYVVKLPNGKIFVKCEAFQDTVEIGSVIKEFQPPTITYPDEGNAPIGFTWSKMPELAYGGTLSDLYSDWEIARDELYTVLLFSSYNNIVDLYSIDVVLSASGTAYMRTRYGGNIDGEAVVGPWEEAVVEISGVPPLWAPADIPGVIVFDALDSDNITLSGSSVTSWADMMGSGIAAVQDTPSLQPTMGTGEVVFAEDYLTIASSNGAEWCRALHSTGGHILALVQPFESANPNAAVCLCGTNGAGATANIGMTLTFDDRSSVPRNDSIVINATRGSTGANSVQSVHQDIITGGSYHLIDIIIDPDNEIALSRSLCSVNGADDLTINTSASSASTFNARYNFQIGAGGNNVFPLTGRIKCFAITPSVLTTTEREKFVGWAAHRHGLASNLPDDHPYKYAPPRKFAQDTWTPSEITTALWLDYLDDLTITLVGDKVSAWADKSGNNRHASMGTDSLRPVVDNGIYFVNKRLNFAALTNVTGFCFYVVAAREGTQKHNTLITVNPGGPSSGNAARTRMSWKMDQSYAMGFSGSAGIGPDISPATDENDFNIFGWRQVLSSPAMFNGSQFAASVSPAADSNGGVYALGTDGWNPGYFRIKELIAVAAYSADTDAKIFGYLAHKHGLAAKLPSDHPYKTAAPLQGIKYVTDNTALISGNLLEGTTGLTISQVNSDPLNVGIDVAGSNGGLFRIYANGSWTFDPNSEFGALFYPETADTSVTYYTSDGVSESMATLMVTITAVASEQDPLWDNVVLCLNAAGADNSTTIIDETGKTPSIVNGDTKIRTVLGYNSIYLDGSGDYVRFGADGTDFDFGSDSFCIEAWLYLNTIAGNLFTQRIASNTSGISFGFHNNQVSITLGNGSSWFYAPSNFNLGVVANTLFHIALIRDGNTIRVCRGGTQIHSGTTTGVVGPVGLPANIGWDPGNSGMSYYPLSGHIKGFRITKGDPRYTGTSFTPDDAPFLA